MNNPTIPIYSSQPIIIGCDGEIAVDNWKQSNACRYFFLTHCHSDHIRMLTPNWRRGPIYCSPISGRLLETMLNMNTEHNQICPLEINIRHRIDDQFWVTLYNANHCIGSVMFLFEIDNYSTVLCTGDMRFDDKMIEMFDNIDVFQRLQTISIDCIYLDTTYLEAQTDTFPSRIEATNTIIDIIRQQPSHMSIIIVLNRLGREEMLVTIAKELQEQIQVEPDRMSILRAVNMADNNLFICDDNNQHRICTLRHGDVNNVLQNDDQQSIIAIYPSMLQSITNYRVGGYKFKDRKITIEYSDHSSRSELIAFLKRLRFKQIIPISKMTISSDRMKQIIDECPNMISSVPIVLPFHNDDTSVVDNSIIDHNDDAPVVMVASSTITDQIVHSDLANILPNNVTDSSFANNETTSKIGDRLININKNHRPALFISTDDDDQQQQLDSLEIITDTQIENDRMLDSQPDSLEIITDTQIENEQLMINVGSSKQSINIESSKQPILSRSSIDLIKRYFIKYPLTANV